MHVAPQAPEPEPAGRPRFAYVVLCHDDAPAVLSLVEALRRLSPGATVLVRHDRPAGYLDASHVADLGAEIIESRITVTWGGWTLVEAMVECMQHAVMTSGADFVVLVSGRDRPFRDLTRWEHEVVATGADALLDLDPSADPARHLYRWWSWSAPSATPRPVARAARWGWQNGLGRLQRRLVAYPTSRDGVWAVGLRRRRDIRQRLGHPYVKASQWMVLSARAVTTVTRASDAATFFRRVRIPDESFVQTVVSAAPDLLVAHRPTTHAVFPQGAASPREAQPDDLAPAVARGAAFVRKVSSAPSSSATVAACDRVAQEEQQGAPSDLRG